MSATIWLCRSLSRIPDQSSVSGQLEVNDRHKSKQIVNTYLGSLQWHLCVSGLDHSVFDGGYIYYLLFRLL